MPHRGLYTVRIEQIYIHTYVYACIYVHMYTPLCVHVHLEQDSLPFLVFSISFFHRPFLSLSAICSKLAARSAVGM